ncbi:nitroreductase family protein [Georgenia sp. EYE_87]|uniref:nitroreductase family protein n=1 Tax=Georgenia sp. EYE_87 TaxID=2853448 RepID=UPI002004C399|nr:nitroreductase family protein [Georgenia sp. EYE_87]MCK6212730.1 nitroreductase family protein [Georgenia sp. EYE_87]
MEFQDVVRRRRMVRRYSAEPVAPGSVDRLVRNAVRAPSAGFSQGWGFLVLDRPEDVSRFWEAATPPARAAQPDRWLRGMRTAPVVIVPFSSEAAYRRRYGEADKARADHAVPHGAGTHGEPAAPPGHSAGGDLPDAAARGAGWAVPYWHVDAGMAALLILQTAVDEGLGACFFGVPASRVAHLRAAFGVPEDHSPVGAVTVGHPAPDERPGGSAVRRPRRPLDDVVHRGRWSS